MQLVRSNADGLIQTSRQKCPSSATITRADLTAIGSETETGRAWGCYYGHIVQTELRFADDCWPDAIYFLTDFDF